MTAPFVPTNVADETIEQPLKLAADSIVKRTKKESDNLIYEIECDDPVKPRHKLVLFSTVSRPLAFAWVNGRNSAPPAAPIKTDDDANSPDNAPSAKPPSGRQENAGKLRG
jgi:hypothetical protein